MRACSILILLAALAGAARAETLKSFDGYGLDYVLETPEGGAASKVVVLLHGSGGHDMDEDLGEVSAPGVKNLFFADVSAALRKKGFAVLRYNKRSYQWRKTVKTEPGFLKSETFLKFSANPLKYFAGDAAAFVDLAAKKFPGGKVYLLGHSEGTAIALRLADADPRIKGAALIGFMAQSLDTAMFEQAVYRSLHIFEGLDADRNGLLDGKELAGAAAGKNLLAQLPLLDLDKDGALSRDEFKAGNFSNLLFDLSSSMPAYRAQEAAYKRPAEIIRDAKFDIAFFQGELDNQTPAYGVKAVEILNKAALKKTNLHFRYFPGLGHALDPRDNYQDILYRPAKKEALEAVAADLEKFWN
jgi:pimeloyl-ACP methyl ester carboxylesterase